MNFVRGKNYGVKSGNKFLQGGYMTGRYQPSHPSLSVLNTRLWCTASLLNESSTFGISKTREKYHT